MNQDTKRTRCIVELDNAVGSEKAGDITRAALIILPGQHKMLLCA